MMDDLDVAEALAPLTRLIQIFVDIEPAGQIKWAKAQEAYRQVWECFEDERLSDA